jgi:hypothetical protein
MSRLTVEGCLLGGCLAASLFYGPAPLIVGIIGVIMAEVSIGKMERDNFLGNLDRRFSRRRGRRR